MADSTTSNISLNKPEVGASADTWGTKINTNFDTLDNLFTAGPALLVTKGGTGATSASDARTNLGLGTVATESTVPVAKGGTGATTLTANNVLLGNGTSALQVVAPSTSGNVLTSNGTTWASSAPAVSSVDSQTGAITLSSLTSFASSLGTSGYQKLPSGLIMQWGSNSAGGNGAASVSFPISFPTACVNVQVTGGYSGTNGNSTGAYSVSTSGFTYTYHYSGTTDYWFAVGY